MGRLRSFTESSARHGFWRTSLRYADALLRRFVDYEICRVESNADDYRDRPDPTGFVTRRVSAREFQSGLTEELAGIDYRWAFDRGDFCIASLKGDRIVGFTFYSRHPTVARPGLVFRFPERFVYSYASMTAASQRGNRLEAARWKAAQAEIIRTTGRDLPRIFYVNIANLESRAANRRSGGNRLIGYTGYLRLGRLICFRSSACRRAEAGIWPDPSTGTPLTGTSPPETS